MTRTYSFEKLEVWQKMKAVSVDVYRLSSKLPSTEQFGLSSQMRRAAVSVCSNIAEGTGRESVKDQRHFYKLAFSSLMELLNQLILTKELTFITDDDYIKIRKDIEDVARMLSGLRKSRTNAKR